jgi:hypothetical protein
VIVAGAGRCFARAVLGLILCGVVSRVAFAADDMQPRFDYVLNCAGCHRMDASGSAVVPSLAGIAPFLATPRGRAYLVRVPGVAQAPLSDERVAALLNWALAEFGGAEKFAPYSAAEVAALRAAPLRDPFGERDKIHSEQSSLSQE